MQPFLSAQPAQPGSAVVTGRSVQARSRVGVRFCCNVPEPGIPTMKLTTETAAVELTPITCGSCGGTYAISERYHAQRAREGGGWHCPYCQVSWGFFGANTEVARLKTYLDNAQRRTEWAEASAQQERERAQRLQFKARTYKGHLTRIKNRVGQGTCPCCNRQFKDLRRHMASQHPDYVNAQTRNHG